MMDTTYFNGKLLYISADCPVELGWLALGDLLLVHPRHAAKFSHGLEEGKKSPAGASQTAVSGIQGRR